MKATFVLLALSALSTLAFAQTPQPLPSACEQFRTPVVKPDERVDYKGVLVQPAPGVEYKGIVIDPCRKRAEFFAQLPYHPLSRVKAPSLFTLPRYNAPQLQPEFKLKSTAEMLKPFAPSLIPKKAP